MTNRVRAKRKRLRIEAIKIHRSYRIEELARVVGVAKGTVSRWIKDGLSVVDERRPILIRGIVAKAFLKERIAKKKRPSLPGQMYCMKCRVSRWPALNFAELRPWNDSSGSLTAICSTCESIMYRSVSYQSYCVSIGDLEVSVPKGLKRLIWNGNPTLNDNFERGKNSE